MKIIFYTHFQVDNIYNILFSGKNSTYINKSVIQKENFVRSRNTHHKDILWKRDVKATHKIVTVIDVFITLWMSLNNIKNNKPNITTKCYQIIVYDLLSGRGFNCSFEWTLTKYLTQRLFVEEPEVRHQQKIFLLIAVI